jgi:cupin 2 domain-containing protein
MTDPAAGRIPPPSFHHPIATDGMPNNLLQNLPDRLADEWTTILARSPHVRIERIVSTGQASPPGFWYDQDEHEWVVVMRGAARLRMEDGCVDLKPGDSLLIPAHQKHRVEWTSPDEPTVWLAVFYDAQELC